MNWSDYWRLFNVVATAACLMVLLIRYFRFARTYNQKTLDYWYALTAWTVAGLVGSAFSILNNAPTNPGTMITSVAVVVSLKGLLNKSQWGGHS